MVGRRRGRAKQKFFHWNDLSEMDTSTDEDANVDVPHVSSTKGKGKQKGKSTVRITKKGKLGMISEMPLDVLYEVRSVLLISHHGVADVMYLRRQIFFFLSPRDLVRMSWTNKEFRRILTSRVTRNIWRAALESIEGLPQCPTHMNEIEYSTVLFCPTCYVGPFCSQFLTGSRFPYNLARVAEERDPLLTGVSERGFAKNVYRICESREISNSSRFTDDS